ncbi:MAG: tetratricopeptide repeat protein, partial [Ignavibacteria bacterium]|nr:tetratricopeptide repeat protein [Ignavibacteria bacterium]
LGQYTDAISSYNKAVAIKPDYVDVYFNLGNVQSNLGRYSDAVASFDRMIKIKQDDAVAWYYRGNALNNLGQYTEAICSYDKAVAIKPDYAMARTKRRDVQRNLGQHIETESSSDKTIIVKPDVPKVKDTHEKNLNVLDELHPLPENREREGSLFLDQNKLKQKSLSMEKGHILPVENTKLRFLSQYKVSAPPPKTKIIRKYGAISRKKYIFPILEYLVLNNGTITTDIADDIIGSRFAKDFTSIDYEFHKDGTRRWEKNVDYATYIMKSNGLLKQDTLSEYKITEYGRQCYLKLKENPLTVINISNNKLTFYSP